MRNLMRMALPAFLAGLGLAQTTVLAQQYPSRPIRLIISFPAGGGVDTAARILAQKMGESMGQQVVVDNRPGGNTVISAEAAARTAPDGYTIFMPLDFTMTMNTSLFTKLPYDPLRYFSPITQVVSGNMIIVANPKVPGRNFQEVIAYARANPGKLNYGASAMLTRLIGEQIKYATRTEMVYVPYKGTAPMVQAVLGGEIELVVDGLPIYVQHVKEGKLRALATTGPKRDALLPETPTVRELGFPELEVRSWLSLFAPAGTPRSVVAKLNAEAAKALADPGARERLAAMGFEPIPGSPEQLTAAVKADTAKWAPMIKAAGISLD